MTIKDLPKLEPIQAHFLNSRPLDNDFATAVQSTDFYKETRSVSKPDFYRILTNKLAYELKFRPGASVVIKQTAIEEYGQEAVNNASRYLSNIRTRSNIPSALQIATIAWFVNEIIDIEKTQESNGWDLKAWTPPAPQQPTK